MCPVPQLLFLKYHSYTIDIQRYRRVSGIGNMNRPSINVPVFEYGCLEQETINILFQWNGVVRMVIFGVCFPSRVFHH